MVGFVSTTLIRSVVLSLKKSDRRAGTRHVISPGVVGSGPYWIGRNRSTCTMCDSSWCMFSDIAFFAFLPDDFVGRGPLQSGGGERGVQGRGRAAGCPEIQRADCRPPGPGGGPRRSERGPAMRQCYDPSLVFRGGGVDGWCFWLALPSVELFQVATSLRRG